MYYIYTYLYMKLLWVIHYKDMFLMYILHIVYTKLLNIYKIIHHHLKISLFIFKS